jgi:hypothetical protein
MKGASCGSEPSIVRARPVMKGEPTPIFTIALEFVAPKPLQRHRAVEPSEFPLNSWRLDFGCVADGGDVLLCFGTSRCCALFRGDGTPFTR